MAGRGGGTMVAPATGDQGRDPAGTPPEPGQEKRRQQPAVQLLEAGDRSRKKDKAGVNDEITGCDRIIGKKILPSRQPEDQEDRNHEDKEDRYQGSAAISFMKKRQPVA